MKQFITVTFLFLLLFKSYGQSTDTTYNKLYFSVNLGTTILMNDASVGLGYRLSEKSTFGVDYRRFSYVNLLHVDFGSVRGINIFFEYNHGIYIKGGIGLPLKSKFDADFECISCFRYEYISRTGSYLFSSIGYQLKIGFTLGLNISFATQMMYDAYLVDFSNRIGTFDHVKPNVNMEVITVNLGYIFPAYSKRSIKGFFFK